MVTNISQLITAKCLARYVYINGIEGFWSFAKENMAKHHKFLLYIKEMEWRYNNRDEDTFSIA